MNNTVNNIEPSSETEIKTYTSFTIDRCDVVPFKSATLFVKLNDASGRCIAVKNLVMSGNDYTSWGFSDDYIISFVMSKLGFVSPILV